MRLRPTALVVLLLALLLAAPPAPAKKKPPSQWLVLTNVTVVDVRDGSNQPGMTVVIRNDRITAIAKRALIQIDRNVQVVNATGQYLIPGLWDMHVHLVPADGGKWARPVVLPLLVANGVTGVRDMGGDWKALSQLKKEVQSGALPGPRIVTPGPFVDGRAHPGEPVVAAASAEEARAAVRSLKAEGVDFIKVQSLLPRDAFLALADEARRQRIPFVGHVPLAVNAAEASDAGMASMEHLLGILLSCSRREEEIRRTELETIAQRDTVANVRAQFEEMATFDPGRASVLFAKLAANHTWQTPTLVFLRARARADEPFIHADPRLQYLPGKIRGHYDSKEIPPGFTPDDLQKYKQLYERKAALVAPMRRAGVEFLAGSDDEPLTVPGFSLHDELELLVSAGLTRLEALQAATLNPAKFLGKERDLGTVEPGKVADLVLLDADPMEDIRNTRKIRGVVLNGRFLDRAALDKLLAEARAAKKTP